MSALGLSNQPPFGVNSWLLLWDSRCVLSEPICLG